MQILGMGNKFFTRLLSQWKVYIRKPCTECIFQLTRSNIFTNFSSCLDLFNKHPKYQHPPINMHNKQAVKKTIEHIIIYWTIHLVLFLIQGEQNFIAGKKRSKTIEQRNTMKYERRTALVLLLKLNC